MTKIVAFLMMIICIPVFGESWSGNLAYEASYFLSDAAYSSTLKNDLSMSFQPQFQNVWNEGRESLKAVPFFRLDVYDANRTHWDFRELCYVKAINDWEWRVGISKVFWGVTESQNPVDIINQTDQVEGLDGKEKLGQPMINLNYVADLGTLSFFVLPLFRERTFPSTTSRPQSPTTIAVRHPVYESPEKDRHIDVAMRWSSSFENIDLGVHVFNGTSRIPDFIFQNNAFDPYYL